MNRSSRYRFAWAISHSWCATSSYCRTSLAFRAGPAVRWGTWPWMNGAPTQRLKKNTRICCWRWARCVWLGISITQRRSPPKTIDPSQRHGGRRGKMKKPPSPGIGDKQKPRAIYGTASSHPCRCCLIAVWPTFSAAMPNAAAPPWMPSPSKFPKPALGITSPDFMRCSHRRG